MTLHELIEIDISCIQNNLLHISHSPTSYTRLHDRIIPLHPRIQPILRKWIEQGKPQLYINSTRYYSISYYLRNYCRLAGLALLHHEFLLKDLRYTFQINLENTSATTTQMAVLLGNKLRSVGGRVYTHPTINRLTQIINELQ